MKATAIAHPNIAVIKYWGKRDIPLNLPSVPSISVTLSQFFTETTVEWGSSKDQCTLNGEESSDAARKVFQFLDRVDADRPYCRVVSRNNFPTAAGLASSASAFAALALAASSAANKNLSPRELSLLARQGSGSAARSIWGGWVQWQKGINSDGSDSYAFPIAPQDHWDIRIIVAVVSDQKKKISSRKAMNLSAETSPFFQAWCDTAEEDIRIAKEAIQNKNLNQLGRQMEHSTMKMFGTMFATQPSIRYWKSDTLSILDKVETLRETGIDCWATMDAGPNVKILCLAKDAEKIQTAIDENCIVSHVLSAGSDARII